MTIGSSRQQTNPSIQQQPYQRELPLLFHRNSNYTLDASDDYLSFSDLASDDGESVIWKDPGERLFTLRPDDPQIHAFNTFNSHPQQPQQYPTASSSAKPKSPVNMGLVKMNPSPRRRPLDEANDPAFRFTSPSSNPGYSVSELSLTSPTPQIDNSPYIHFALNQLTSDYPPTGDPNRSRASFVPPSSVSSYPVDRGIPDEGLGYIQPSHSASVSKKQTPLIPATMRAKRFPDSGSNTSLPEQQPLRKASAPVPVRSPNFSRTNTTGTLPTMQEEDLTDDDDLGKRDTVYIPCDAPEGSYKHPPLTYVPGLLRIPALLGYLAISLAAVALLIWTGVKAIKNSNITTFEPKSQSQYFVYRFLPQFVAGLFLLAQYPLRATLVRIAPFISMTSSNAHARSRAQFLPLYITNFLLPDIRYFTSGSFVIGGCLFVLWLQLFTVPLMSSLFQIRLYADSNNLVHASYTICQGALWAVVGIYLLLAIALIVLFAFFFRRTTGLKWLPVSLADMFVLIRKSNCFEDLAGAETFQSPHEFQNKLRMRSDRLGYWRTEDDPRDTFYAIAEEGEAPRRFSVMRGRTREKKPDDSEIWGFSSRRPVSDATSARTTINLHSPYVRYAYIPWYLSDGAVVAWIVIGFGLLIAFIVVSFTHHAISRGFDPMLAIANIGGSAFSPATFLYSFLPSLLGMIIHLCWNSIDVTFRALQPYANLANRNGASAESTLLLDYTLDASIVSAAKALLSGHWKVALFSFVSFTTTFLPILAGGVFEPLFDLQNSPSLLVRTKLEAFGGILFFLVLAVLALLLAFPTRKRYLPHRAQTTSEVFSFLYASTLLDERAFRDPLSKIDMHTRLIRPLSGDGGIGEFTFTVFEGRDGQEHLGIERYYRDGSDSNLPIEV
jgi:hypothetical protein